MTVIEIVTCVGVFVTADLTTISDKIIVPVLGIAAVTAVNRLVNRWFPEEKPRKPRKPRPRRTLQPPPKASP
jgi:hypothetical protein